MGQGPTRSQPAVFPPPPVNPGAAGRRNLAPPATGEQKGPGPVGPRDLLSGRVVDGGGAPLPGRQVLLCTVALSGDRQARGCAAALGRVIRKRVAGMEPFGGTFEPGALYGRLGMARPDDLRQALAKALREGRGDPRKAALAQLLGTVLRPLEKIRIAVTDGDGRYRFEGVVSPEGKAVVVGALSRSARLDSRWVSIGPDHLVAAGRAGSESGRGPRLVLVAPCSIAGILQGSGGNRFGAQVLAWRLADEGPIDRARAVGDKGGAFVLQGLRPGRWRLAAISKYRSGEFAWGPVVELAEGQNRTGVLVPRQGPTVVTFRARWADGDPVLLPYRVGVVVDRLGPPGGPGWEARSPAHDRSTVLSRKHPGGPPLQVAHFAPGAFRVDASLDGIPTTLLRKKKGPTPWRIDLPVTLEGDRAAVDLTFPKRPVLSSILVRCRDDRGEPVSGARVGVRHLVVLRGKSSHFTMGTRNGVTGGDGALAVTDLFPGRYQVTAAGDGLRTVGAEVDLSKGEPGRQHVQELVLRRQTVVRISLVDDGGRPLRRFSVGRKNLTPPPQEPGPEEPGGTRQVIIGRGRAMTTGSTLDLVLDKPGRWRLTVHRKGRLLATREVVIGDREFKRLTVQAEGSGG